MNQVRTRCFGVFSVVCLCLAAATSSLQASQFLLFPFDEELSRSLQTFQTDPEPERVFDIFFETDLDAFDRQAAATDQSQSRAVLTAFYVQILQIHPELTQQFASRIISENKPAHASFGTDVIAAASTEQRDAALAQIIEHFSLPPDAVEMIESRERFDYHQLEADDAMTLDVLWACYFGSGDPDFVPIIASALEGHPTTEEAMSRLRALGASRPRPGSPEYREAIALAVGEAARKGLTDVATRDPGFRAVLEELSRSDGSMRPILEPILRSASPSDAGN